MTAIILGAASTYEDLQYLLRLRADQLEVSRETIDELGGFADGYAGKVLRAKPIKTIGWWCLPDMLRVLGLKMLLVEDKAALRRTRSKSKKRQKRQVRNGSMVLPAISKYLSKIAVKGGTNHYKKLSRDQIRAMMAKQWDERRKSGAKVNQYAKAVTQASDYPR